MRKNPNTHGDKCIMKLIKLYMSTQIYIHTQEHILPHHLLQLFIYTHAINKYA